MATMDYNLNPRPNAGTEALYVGEATLSRREVNDLGVEVPSGEIRFTYFTASKSETIGRARVVTAWQPAGATPTLCKIGVYEENPDQSLTRVAVSANNTGLFTVTYVPTTIPFIAPFFKEKGKRYAVALLTVTAATTPNFAGILNNLWAENAEPPVLARSLPAQADLGASYTYGVLTNASGIVYAVVAP